MSSKGGEEKAKGRESAPGQQQMIKIVNPSTEETKTIAKSEWNRDLREDGWQRLDETDVASSGRGDPPRAGATPAPAPAEETGARPEPLHVEGSNPANEAFGQK